MALCMAKEALLEGVYGARPGKLLNCLVALTGNAPAELIVGKQAKDDVMSGLTRPLMGKGVPIRGEGIEWREHLEEKDTDRRVQVDGGAVRRAIG